MSTALDRDLATMHVGRSWTGHSIEDDCPCPSQPCGLVTINPDCPQHSLMAAKTIRQSHTPQKCSAANEGADPTVDPDVTILGYRVRPTGWAAAVAEGIVLADHFSVTVEPHGAKWLIVRGATHLDPTTGEFVATHWTPNGNPARHFVTDLGEAMGLARKAADTNQNVGRRTFTEAITREKARAAETLAARTRRHEARISAGRGR